MDTVAWILQVLLAVMFGGAGFLKLTSPREAMVERMAWVNDFSANQVKLIGLLEVLAALGLILPSITRILPVLTPLAAVGLIIVMLGAAFTHFRRKEYAPIAINLFALVLAAVVAYARFVSVPLT